MNLVLEEKQFPLWLVPQATVSDQRLERLREANQKLRIEREESGELFIDLKTKPAAAPHRK